MLILCLDDARKNKRPIKTLRYLLERRVVSDNAVPGGVTVALQKAQLWVSHLLLIHFLLIWHTATRVYRSQRDRQYS